MNMAMIMWAPWHLIALWILFWILWGWTLNGYGVKHSWRELGPKWHVATLIPFGDCFDWDAFMQLDTESVEYDPLFSFLCTYLWGWKIVRIGGEGWCPWHLVHNLNKTFGKIKMKFGKLKHVVGELDRFVRSFFMKLSKECYLTPSTQNMS
jgi:hypothetical protein